MEAELDFCKNIAKLSYKEAELRLEIGTLIERGNYNL